MSLKISRDITTIDKSKIGRNDPCYCGSGKKYKKCCLLKEQSYSPNLKSGHISYLNDWLVENVEGFKEDIVDLLKELYGAQVTLEEQDLHEVNECLLFEGRYKGSTYLEYFLAHAPLTDEQRMLYMRWQDETRYSPFLVKQVHLGKGMDVTDLLRGDSFFISERLASYQVQAGMVLISRTVPFDGGVMFTGAALHPFPREAADAFLQKEAQMRKEAESFTQTMFLKVMRGALENTGSSGLSYEELLKKLQRKIDKYGGSVDMRSEIETLVANGKKMDPAKVIPRITRGIQKGDEMQEVINLFLETWNNHPEIVSERSHIGPEEQAVVDAMMREVHTNEFKALPPTKRQPTVDAFTKKWYATPHQKFHNRTPAEVINEERKRLGNSTPFNVKDYRLQLTSTEPEEMSLYYQGVEAFREGDYLESLQLLAQAYPVLKDMDDSFRWFSNMGGTLAYLGERALAEQMVKTSLAINPKYTQGKHNLKNLEKLPKQTIWVGRQEIFDELLVEDKLHFSADFTFDCPMLSDMITFLSDIGTTPVQVDKEYRELKLPDVRRINALMLEPSPEEITTTADNVTTTSVFDTQSQYAKVNFLFYLCLDGRLTNLVKNSYVITEKGKTFLSKKSHEQLADLLIMWWMETDWSLFAPTDMPDEDSDIDAQNRDRSDFSFTEHVWDDLYLYLRAVGENTGGMSIEHIVKTIFDPRVIARLGKKPANMAMLFSISSLFLEIVLIRYLAWANILSPVEKSSNSILSYLQTTLRGEYRLTSFGTAVLDQVEDQISAYIRAELEKYGIR